MVVTRAERRKCDMKCKKIMAAALAAALSIGSTMSSMAAVWEKVGSSDWKYVKDDGQYATSMWVYHTDGHWYYLNPNTLMAKGWVLDPADNHWYFTDSTGALVSGLIEVNDHVYYMNESHDGSFGALFVGVKTVNGVAYNFTDNGTTNGKPYTSRRYRSDGTAIVMTATSESYGGGYSGGSYTPSDPTAEKMNAVEKGMDTVANNNTAVVDIDVSTLDAGHNSSVVVELAQGAVDSKLEQVQDAAKAAANVVLNQADSGSQVVISVPGLIEGKTLTVAEAKDRLGSYITTWVTKNNYDSYKGATVTVVMNGQTVAYTITLEEIASK